MGPTDTTPSAPRSSSTTGSPDGTQQTSTGTPPPAGLSAVPSAKTPDTAQNTEAPTPGEGHAEEGNEFARGTQPRGRDGSRAQEGPDGVRRLYTEDTDTLDDLAEAEGVDRDALYRANQGAIEAAAQARGFGGSDNGRILSPGILLDLP